MSSIDVQSVLEGLAPPAASRRRRLALETRPLDPPAGRVVRAALVLDLGRVPVPPRSRALLTGSAEGLGDVEAAVVRWTHARLVALVRGLVAGEVRVAAFRPDAAGLTGLGPGLTPTGDDVLVGLAAMSRRLVGGGLLEPRAAVAFETTLAGLPAEGTTPAARALLEAASRGAFPVVLADLVEAFGGTDVPTDRLRLLAERLAAIGAHSGTDLLAGALALVEALVGQERP
ncbi:MAG: oxamate carbamoyltransferase subunit AllH family protein [Thermoanaerobaculia bacterium]